MRKNNNFPWPLNYLTALVRMLYNIWTSLKKSHFLPVAVLLFFLYLPILTILSILGLAVKKAINMVSNLEQGLFFYFLNAGFIYLYFLFFPENAETSKQYFGFVFLGLLTGFIMLGIKTLNSKVFQEFKSIFDGTLKMKANSDRVDIKKVTIRGILDFITISILMVLFFVLITGGFTLIFMDITVLLHFLGKF
ncbi:MAG TPA: hypothetical protein VFF13_01800 [archaeon]|nr:hypothetical protein [archaeon]